MIKEIDSMEDIVLLWQEAFGDSREDIVFFADNLRHGKAIGLYEGDDLLSMLYLIDCTVCGEPFKYIYAACTANRARRNGCMSTLLDYCLSAYSNVLLVPADNDLVLYYSKRNFTHKIDISNILFNESEEIKEYLFDGCALDKPFALANKGV